VFVIALDFIYERNNFTYPYNEIKNIDVVSKKIIFILEKKTLCYHIIIHKITAANVMSINLKRKTLPGSKFNGHNVTFLSWIGFIFPLQNTTPGVHPTWIRPSLIRTFHCAHKAVEPVTSLLATQSKSKSTA
jgi:hypothetical protein